MSLNLCIQLFAGAWVKICKILPVNIKITRLITYSFVVMSPEVTAIVPELLMSKHEYYFSVIISNFIAFLLLLLIFGIKVRKLMAFSIRKTENTVQTDLDKSSVIHMHRLALLIWLNLHFKYQAEKPFDL